MKRYVIILLMLALLLTLTACAASSTEKPPAPEKQALGNKPMCDLSAQEPFLEPFPGKIAIITERFDMNEEEYRSRLISSSVADNLIKPLDPKTAPRYMCYIPFWA